VACGLKTAAKLTEEIEIQIAGGNLLRIRSTTVSRNYAHIPVAEFFVSGRACPCQLPEIIFGERNNFLSGRPGTQMETAWNFRIEFRARNL
jgi:hypothetical protein